MAKMFEVDIVGRETIKPSSPTPDHLRTFKLSLIDQHSPASYSQVLLFYTAAAATSPDSSPAAAPPLDKSRRLKKSLSDVLTRFYPLAGRIKDHLSVNCNDEGGDYTEARVDRTLKDILEKPNNKMFRALVVMPDEGQDPNQIPLLFLQVTSFACGGTALGFSFSHKLADGATMGTFITAFADACSESPTAAVEPDLTAISSLLHPSKSLPEEKFRDGEFTMVDGIPSRYVFDSASIAALKAKAASESVPVPTRFEAVSALIWKCLIANSSTPESAVNWSVNVRSYMEPPLPQSSFGNMYVFLPILCKKEQIKLVELSELVELMRSNINELRGSIVKKLFGENGTAEYLKGHDDLISLILCDRVDLYFTGSWCRFPFYQADFGWGKPAWVTAVPSCSIPELLFLLDTRDGDGIEVLVNFADEDQLALFEENTDLKAHALFNPSPL